MPTISEFIREGPAYKKAILAVALTTGVGVVGYIVYRRFSEGQSSSKPSPSPRGPTQVGEKDTSKPTGEKSSPTPSKEKTATPTGGERSTTQPSGEKDTAKKVGEKIAPQPSPGKAAPQPSGEKATTPQSGQKPTPQPVLVDKKDSQVQPAAKDEAARNVLSDKNKSPSKVKDAPKGSPQIRAEDLSVSGTFEKVSMGSNEPDNFEHLTMSQVHKPDRVVPEAANKGAKAKESLPSSQGVLQDKSKSGTPSSLHSGAAESMSMSQADPSMSIISTSEIEESKKKPQTVVSALQLSDTGHTTEGKSALRDVAPATAATAATAAAAASPGVKVKDENDIVVVEKSAEESDTGSDKSEEFRGPRSGMASADIEFDASRVSPVFGRQTYRRVSVEEDDHSSFDPAKRHPAVFGFKFDGQS